jgi:putative tryptophan/tyrosine transport system substrate-binding protein
MKRKGAPDASATNFALFVNPNGPVAEAASDVQAASSTLGPQVHILRATSEGDFDSVFAILDQQRPGGLVIAPYLFLLSRTEQFAGLALRHAVLAIFQNREFAALCALLEMRWYFASVYGQLGAAA